MTWTKVDAVLKDRQGVLIKTSEWDTLLMIEDINRYDAGKYVLSLENSSGCKSYTIVVKVLGKRAGDALSTRTLVSTPRYVTGEKKYVMVDKSFS